VVRFVRSAQQNQTYVICLTISVLNISLEIHWKLELSNLLKGLAFPQDQPTMTSYELVTSEDKKEESKLQPIDERDGVFTEDDIKKAFALFDLDKNGYIGAAELRHILIFMGEHVTDEEVDMMISMLDMNGETSLLQCGIYIIIFAPITYFCVYGRR
jgi:calmodulin